MNLYFYIMLNLTLEKGRTPVEVLVQAGVFLSKIGKGFNDANELLAIDVMEGDIVYDRWQKHVRAVIPLP